MTRAELTAPPLYVSSWVLEHRGPLLDLLPTTDGYAWLWHGEGLVAWGEVVRHKPTSLSEAEEWWA